MSTYSGQINFLQDTSDFIEANTGTIISLTGELIELDTGSKIPGRILGPFGIASDVFLKSLDEDGLTRHELGGVAAVGFSGYVAGALIGLGTAGMAAPIAASLGVGLIVGVAYNYLVPEGEDKIGPVTVTYTMADGSVEKSTHTVIGQTWVKESLNNLAIIA